MTNEATMLWVAHGKDDRVVGSIKKTGEGYTATMSGAAEPTGTYGEFETAKHAVHAHLPAGSDRPRFDLH